MTKAATHDPSMPSKAEWLMAIVIGCCLSAFVWRGLLSGGGLVGGDTYPYFFPQKQVLAESLARGEVPLWHDRTSLGYPIHAESQAGVFYPTNQILYRLFDINTAYSVSVMLHYAAAFVFAWRFCRCQSLRPSSAMLAAMIFVYGWFPVRVSLEWSIIGGMWFPLCLWMVDRMLSKPSMRRWAAVTVCFGLHLLAGHFTLAFITQLTCLMYTFLWRVSRNSPSALAVSSLPASESPVMADQSPAQSATLDRTEPISSRWVGALLVASTLAGAILLSAVQLLPTLELRQLSQRDGAHTVFNPAYGHMPPVYLTQLFASWWYWHTPEMAMSRAMLKYPLLTSPADTNPVEAHFYLGLIPFFLLSGLLSRNVRWILRRTQWKTWLILSLCGIVYAFGWLVPLFQHLPGFGFFMGPGRYTIVSTMGLAIIAGLVLDALQRRQRPSIRIAMTLLIAGLTLADVLKSAEFPVCDAQVVSVPPIAGLSESWLKKTLQAEDQKAPVRLLVGGPNIGNLFGISSVPQYLGLGPSEYFSDEHKVETQPASSEAMFPSIDQWNRLRALSVTHVLTTERVQNPAPGLELVHSEPDTFLNRVWARGNEDCYLYRILEPGARITSEPTAALTSINIVRRLPSDIQLDVELAEAASVKWNDLMFPGWTVLVDDQPAIPTTQSGFGRLIEVPAGRHTIQWLYRPGSFRIGAVLSCGTVMILFAACWFRRRAR